jgi:hypothetical protein
MKSNDDKVYLARRAKIERTRAETTTDRAAAVAHLAMAEEYERRAQAADAENRVLSQRWSVSGQAQRLH